MGLFKGSRPPTFKIQGTANKIRNTSNAAMLQSLNSIPWSQQAQDSTIGAVRDAYASQATRIFDQGIKPQLNNIMTSTASRFGGLGNTSYINQLQQYQQNTLQPAYANIADQAVLKGYDIYNQNMQTKYQGLSALNNTLNGVYNRQAQATSLDQAAFNSRKPSMLSNFVSAVGNTAGGLFLGNNQLGSQLTGTQSSGGTGTHSGTSNNQWYGNVSGGGGNWQ